MDRRSATTSLAAAAVTALAAAGGRSAGARTQETREMPSGPRPSFVETDDGASLFYVDWGAGKPVLFTHAWGLNGNIWEYQLTELVDQGLRCIAYDRRGHGRSTDPGRGYDYDRLADDLARSQRRHARRLLDGQRRSGPIPAATWQRSDRAAPDGEHDPPQSDGSLFNGMIAALKQDRPAFFANGVTAFTGGHAAVSPAMTEWVIAQFMRASPKGTTDCMRAISRGDFRADMRAVTVPTLIVHGDKDQVNPLETAKKAAELIPGCALKVYEEAPHGLVITHRDRLAQDILAFARG
jgi:pimeloyl-ACP methyl ester carboxylesterase